MELIWFILFFIGLIYFFGGSVPILFWVFMFFVMGGGAIVWRKIDKRDEKLKKAFNSLKPLEGRTKAKVVNALGSPTLVEHDNGDEYLTWDVGKVSIRLRFEDRVCQEVCDETE